MRKEVLTASPVCTVGWGFQGMLTGAPRYFPTLRKGLTLFCDKLAPIGSTFPCQYLAVISISRSTPQLRLFYCVFQACLEFMCSPAQPVECQDCRCTPCLVPLFSSQNDSLCFGNCLRHGSQKGCLCGIKWQFLGSLKKQMSQTRRADEHLLEKWLL